MFRRPISRGVIWRAAMVLLAVVAVATLLTSSIGREPGATGAATATPSDQAYFIASDGTITPVDATPPAATTPTPTPTPAPTPTPTPVGPSPSPSPSPSGSDSADGTSGFIDTSVVGQFHEPTGHRDHDNWKICGAGALRILLAFVGMNPRWAVAYKTGASGTAPELLHVWPAMGYKDKWSIRSRQPSGFPGGVDTLGQGYMLFMAYSIHPPNWAQGRSGTFDGVGENTHQLVDIANWEYHGEPATIPLRPFDVGSPLSSFAVFDASVRNQISVKHVPVAVSVMTGSYPPDGDGSRGLPDWKIRACTKYAGKYRQSKCIGEWVPYGDVPDWIAITGYDRNYYYYLCTCWAQEKCERGPLTKVANYPGSTHPYTWRVDKATMYWEMTRQRFGGWLIYTGPPSTRTTGW